MPLADAQLDKKTEAFDALKSEILTLDLAPGEALDEARVAERFGLSRTPLREVLQRLAGAGFVDIQAHRGAKVVSMDLGIMRTFFQTAPLIYCSVARLAAENHSGDQLDRLEAIQHDFTRVIKLGDAAAAATYNHHFHAQIGAMADNPYLQAALERMLIDHTRLSQTFYRPASKQETELVMTASHHHDEMIEGFRDRNAEAVVEITLKHWDLSRNQLERFVKPDPLPLDIEENSEPRHAV